MSYCVCVSGNLGLKVLVRLFNDKVPISCVLTDSKSNDIRMFCDVHMLKVYVGNPRDHKAIVWINNNDIKFEYLLSINYLFILENDVLDLCQLAINFHGSLLPKYRGRTPHVWAIINGEKECGITAHLMNSQCDDGDIIKQLHVSIDENDTGATILDKYNVLYPNFVLEIVNNIDKGVLTFCKQDKTKATYFGKRTPKDGHINWNWQKECIRNWVRAQANPYPGAFTYLGEHKIIINKIEFSDYGFSYDMPNGQVIDMQEKVPFVKTPNGVIMITNFHGEREIKLGDILE